jgi:hypothetical protein
MPKPVNDMVDTMLDKTEKKSYWMIDGKLIKTALDVKIHQAQSADRFGNFRLADNLDKSLRFAYQEDEEEEEENWHAQSGEYWIDDYGNAQYADGDVGDVGHEELAEQEILGRLGFDPYDLQGDTDLTHNSYTAGHLLDSLYDDPILEDYYKYLIDNGLTKEDYDIESYLRYLRHRNRPQENHEEYNKQTESLIAGLKDPRNHAIFNFGWIRVVKRGTTVDLELEKLNQKTLKNISSAIGEITSYQENPDRLKFNIEVFSPRHISLNDITLKDIENGSVQSKYLQGIREMLPPQVAEEYYKNFFGTVGHPYYKGRVGD